MLKIVAALLVGAALGFVGGFFVFDWRWGDPGRGEVEAAVAAYAARAGTEVLSVECEELLAPAGTWDCDIDQPGVSAIEAFSSRYRARVQGESIRVEQREP